jgi:succinoglycan biosynthesis transport protein ExoP
MANEVANIPDGSRTDVGQPHAARATAHANLPFLMDVVRRWGVRLIVLGIVCGGAAGAVGYALWAPTYESEAVLIVNPSLVFAQDHFDTLQFSRSQLEIIKSPAVLEAALADERVRTLLAERRIADPLAWVKKRLDATVMGESQLFVVKVKAEDPEIPPPLVEAICRAYLDYFANDASGNSQSKIKTIRDQVEKIEREIVHNEKEIDALSKKAAAAGSVAGRIEVGGVRPAEQLQGELGKTQRELKRLTAEIDVKRRQSQALPPSFGESGDELRRLISENMQAMRRLREDVADLPRTAKMRRTAMERDQRRLEAEAAALDAKLRAVLLAAEIAELERSRDRHQLDETDLVARIAKEQGVATENVQAYLRMTSIQQKTQAARQLSDDLNRKLTNLEMDNPIERVKVMKAAVGPAKKTDDGGPVRRAALIGAAGFLLPALLVLLREFLQQRIGNSADLARLASFPVVGEIALAPPKEPSGRPSGKYQLDAARFHESVDYLRVSLLSSPQGGGVRSVAVVSALSGEGKSTLSANLARSFVEGSIGRVLLIDGDMRCPSLHRTFNAPLQPGLADLLGRKADLRSTLRATSIERLDFLPAGNLDAPVSGLFVGDNFRMLIERLRGSYDFIIVDTPPIMPVGDALMIGAGVDGVVFCTLRDKSDATSVLKARQRFANAGIRVLAAVLNGSPSSSFGNSDYYYARNGRRSEAARLPAPT